MNGAAPPVPALAVAIDVSAIHATSGGARTYVRELVRALPGAGIAPVLIGRRHDPGDWPGAASLARVAPDPRPLRLAWEQVGLPRVLGGLPGAPTVLHSPHYTMPEHLRRGAAVARVVTIHDLTFFTRPERHQRAKVMLFRRAIRVAARRADALVCISEHTASALREHVEASVPVHVIPHGVDHDRFRPEPGPDDAAILAALPVRSPYIVHVGAIEPRKNLPALIVAHEGLVRAGLDLDLVLVGSEPKGTSVALPAGAATRVHRIGFVPDHMVPVLLRHAAVAVYPSVEEGFGLPVLEALAVGTPVVTTAGSVMAAVADGAAWTVPANDIPALAEAIEAAAASGPAARRAAVARAAAFSWTASAAAHAALYRTLAGR